MGLIDLKSNLSNYRKPKPKPLVEKDIRVAPNKSVNQTPLTNMLSNIPKVTPLSPTDDKKGVTQKRFGTDSQFLGLTDPTLMDNSFQFLGITERVFFDNTPTFLGITEPTFIDNNPQFLGITEPTPLTLEAQFLGITDPTLMNLESRFLGETEPTIFSNASQFLGVTVQTLFNNDSQFLGITPRNFFDNSSQFLGVTPISLFNNASNFLGETSPTVFNNDSQFLGVTEPDRVRFNPDLESQATTPKYVDFMGNQNATGFIPNITTTNYVGVDFQSNFYNTTSILGFNNPTRYNVRRDLDNGIRLQYTDGVLNDLYNRFVLKNEAYNTSWIKEPFITTGIQKKNGEPFRYGNGLSLIRGGGRTAASRALIDVQRISSFLLTPRGILWSIKQVGMQRGNRYNKIWTPVNLLANVGGGFLGLHTPRHGIGPETIGGTYEKDTFISFSDEVKYNTKLLDIYERFDKIAIGGIIESDVKGGFESVYGLGTTEIRRTHSTLLFPNENGTLSQRSISDVGIVRYEDVIPIDDQNLPLGDLSVRVTKENGYDPEKSKNEGGSFYDDGHRLTKREGDSLIKSYQKIGYGSIKKLSAKENLSLINDFRNEAVGEVRDIAQKADYPTFNVERRVHFPNVGKVGDRRVDWTNLSKSSTDNSDRWDTINGSDIGETPKNDLIHLFFYVGGDTLQFRGLVSGITEQFQPGWNAQKYLGRADQAYMYDSFERSLNFSFKAMATSRIEMKPMWKKLQRLATYTMPTYSDNESNGYNGQIVYFRLGNIYGTGNVGVPALIDSLTYTYPDDLPWEISVLGSENPLGELPMGVDVNISLKLLPQRRYEYGSRFYSARWFSE